MTMKRQNDLVSDQRGAIMMMGLASACLLIGALWFLMGVADTIIWRDRMQEAVDAAAFSSATIHARGMNFIAAVNLLMLALVNIHLTLGLVADVLTLIAAICLIPPLTPAAAPVYRAALAVRKAQNGYDKFMWIANHSLNAAQTATAVAAPQLGTLAAMEIGAEYDASVMSMGPSNIPMIVPPTGVQTEDGLGGVGGGRLGLPVAFEPYSDMCKRPVYWAVEFVLEGFKRFPVVSWILIEGAALITAKFPLIAPFVIKKFEDTVNEVFRGVAVLFGKTLEAIECNALEGEGEDKLIDMIFDMNVKGIDKIKPGMALLKIALPGEVFPFGANPDKQWSWPGGKKIWGTNLNVKNGSNWMQLWAFTRNEAKIDDHERKVGIARRKYDDIGKNKVIPGNYIAQAEFYYDCGSPTKKWVDFSCNGEIQESHFTMYSMRWVARLKRVKAVSLTSWLFDSAINVADGFDGIKRLLIMIPGVDRILGGVVDLEKLLRGWVDDLLLEPITKWLGYGDPDAEIIH